MQVVVLVVLLGGFAPAGECSGIVGLVCEVAVAVVSGVAEVVDIGMLMLHAGVQHLAGASAVGVVTGQGAGVELKC